MSWADDYSKKMREQEERKAKSTHRELQQGALEKQTEFNEFHERVLGEQTKFNKILVLATSLIAMGTFHSIYFLNIERGGSQQLMYNIFFGLFLTVFLILFLATLHQLYLLFFKKWIYEKLMLVYSDKK